MGNGTWAQKAIRMGLPGQEVPVSLMVSLAIWIQYTSVMDRQTLTDS